LHEGRLVDRTIFIRITQMSLLHIATPFGKGRRVPSPPTCGFIPSGGIVFRSRFATGRCGRLSHGNPTLDRVGLSAVPLDSRQAALAGGISGPALVPGQPEKSLLYTTTLLPADHDQIMPPEGPPLARSQTELLKRWIAAGADWPANAKLAVDPRIDFVTHIQPILEQNCVACHKTSKAEGDYNLSTPIAAIESGSDPPAIVPYRPDNSALYRVTTLAKDDSSLMPPAGQGGPLKETLLQQLRLWIAQGAIWPENIVLIPKAKQTGKPGTPDDLDLVKRIGALIASQPAANQSSKMANYAQTVPLTGARYEMIALAGGSFLMGSPPEEVNRQSTEGPHKNITIEPFWMGKHEVTWDEYEPFMITQVARHKHGARMDYDPATHTIVDAVSQPTGPYVEMSFGMGQRGFPAISMTQHAANKYCQWLSAQTGHFYRLPTEAEWEYACRAGTQTAYSFGKDATGIDDYAWHYENSREKYQKVGQKKPNPWGLHDMHGNVSEWTADQFDPDYFRKLRGGARSPFLRPTRLYPRTVRGGNWDDDPENVRSAARRGSDPIWKQQDPQLPKSIWYHTNAQWLGFRIVRPLKVPSAEEMYFFWNSAAHKM
jgi:formylglycine-generating enzyme required for sulfatase activity